MHSIGCLVGGVCWRTDLPGLGWWVYVSWYQRQRIQPGERNDPRSCLQSVRKSFPLVYKHLCTHRITLTHTITRVPIVALIIADKSVQESHNLLEVLYFILPCLLIKKTNLLSQQKHLSSWTCFISSLSSLTIMSVARLSLKLKRTNKAKRCPSLLRSWNLLIHLCR